MPCMACVGRPVARRRRAARRVFAGSSGKVQSSVPHTVAPAQPAGTGQHRVATGKTAALQPDRLAVAVNPVKQVKTTLFKLLAGSGAAEAEDVPANESAVCGQRNPCFHARPGASKNDRFLRQPLQRGACADREIDALRGFRAAAAIPLAGARRRQLGVGTGVNRRGDGQMVATRNPGRRVQDDSLANGVAFRIQCLLYAQRAAMAVFAQHGSFAGTGEAELQLGMPGRNGFRQRNGKARGHCRIIGERRGGAKYAGIRTVSAGIGIARRGIRIFLLRKGEPDLRSINMALPFRGHNDGNLTRCRTRK